MPMVSPGTSDFYPPSSITPPACWLYPQRWLTGTLTPAWHRGRGRPAVLAKVWSAPPGSRAGELRGWEQGSPTAAPAALPGRLPIGGDPSGGADRAHLSGKVTAMSPEGPKVPEANRGDGHI